MLLIFWTDKCYSGRLGVSGEVVIISLAQPCKGWWLESTGTGTGLIPPLPPRAKELNICAKVLRD
jgi:hypothetical protein